MVSPLDAISIEIIRTSASRISQFGFKKRGNVLRLVSGDNAALVAFQKSRDNTSKRLSFTVNRAVVCGALLYEDEVSLGKATDIDGHLRERLGTFLPGHPDKWWEITDATEKDALVSEVSELICDLAIPYLLHYVETNALSALWESGKSPGLTEGARVNHLSRLKARLGNDQP
jgi:hypothetical protein